MKDRIKYLDVARFIGIYCIYLGHFGVYAGKAYNFVFYFHVPLFFFISGCSESLTTDVTWYKYILKSIKGILIPFYFFAFISLVINTIYVNTHTEVISNIIIILKGCIRLEYFASGLWFLTCLFIIKITFYFLRKLLRFKSLILFVCVVLFIFAEKVITPRPIITPHMIYNIDSACYYIIFYALGYYFFDKINYVLAFDSLVKKFFCTGVGFVSLIYGSLLFFGKNLLGYINTNPVMDLLCSVISPIVIISLVFILSKSFENVEFFNELGKNTLYLCGAEYIIRLLVPICIEAVGLSINLENPLTTYLYSMILLVTANKILVPVGKDLLNRIYNFKHEFSAL